MGSGVHRFPGAVDIRLGANTRAPIANDVEIVYTRSGPVVVAFFASGISGSYAEAEDRIGRLGQALVAFFDR